MIDRAAAKYTIGGTVSVSIPIPVTLVSVGNGDQAVISTHPDREAVLGALRSTLHQPSTYTGVGQIWHTILQRLFLLPSTCEDMGWRLMVLVGGFPPVSV